MTAAPAKLPRDLQGRLDVILAKPVLRRVPLLRQAIEILVRDAYERHPHPVLVIDEAQLTAAAVSRMELARRLEELAGMCRRDNLPVPVPSLDEIRKTAAGERKDGVL
jgi:predicted transcriptional regulator